MELRREYSQACADRESYRRRADAMQDETHQLRGLALESIRLCRELREVKILYKDLKREIAEMKQETLKRQNQTKELECEMGTIREANRKLQKGEPSIMSSPCA